MTGFNAIRVPTSQHRSLEGFKFGKEKTLAQIPIMKDSDPGITTKFPEFMNPVGMKPPINIKFSKDEKSILDKEFGVTESKLKPGPGRYEFKTDFQ